MSDSEKMYKLLGRKFRFENPHDEGTQEEKNYRGEIVIEKGLLGGETYYELLEKDRQDPNKYVLGELTSREGELKRDKRKKIMTKTVTEEVFDQMIPTVIEGKVSVLPPKGGKKRKSRKLKKKSNSLFTHLISSSLSNIW